MSRNIPPLNPLHVFVVAAKTGNFTAAAEALGVTPSAVSRQIAVLEGYLDTRLFHRGVHSNTLTDTGTGYFRQVSPAFEIISLATQSIQDNRSTTPLKIRVLATFGMRFLIPRLPAFRAQYPNIHLSIDTGFAPADFSRADVDVSIQIGDGNWPGTQSHQLFATYIQPICGGRLIEEAQQITHMGEISRLPLLSSKNRPDDWAYWFRARGQDQGQLRNVEMIEFSNSLLMYQAAMDGVGIALGQFPILSQDVASGKLKPLLGPPVMQAAYHAVWRAGAEPNRKMRQFLAWLEKEVEAAFGADMRALDQQS